MQREAGDRGGGIGDRESLNTVEHLLRIDVVFRRMSTTCAIERSDRRRAVPSAESAAEKKQQQRDPLVIRDCANPCRIRLLTGDHRQANQPTLPIPWPVRHAAWTSKQTTERKIAVRTLYCLHPPATYEVNKLGDVSLIGVPGNNESSRERPVVFAMFFSDTQVVGDREVLRLLWLNYRTLEREI
jgi:hypothetical protein